MVSVLDQRLDDGIDAPLLVDCHMVVVLVQGETAKRPATILLKVHVVSVLDQRLKSQR